MLGIENRVRTNRVGVPEPQLREYIAKAIEDELVGSVCLTKYNNRVFRIDAIDMSKTLDDTFTLKDGTEISFRHYMQKQYGIRLESKYPGMIVNIPNKRGPIFLVPELCHLTGVTDPMRSNFKLMRALADQTRLPPTERVKEQQRLIGAMVKQAAKEGAATPRLPGVSFSIKLSDKPVAVQARVLGPFDINFSGGQKAHVGVSVGGPGQRSYSQTNFSREARSAGFMDNNPKAITSWVLLYEQEDAYAAGEFARALQTVSRQQGGSMSEPHMQLVSSSGRPETRWHAGLVAALSRKPPPQVLVCMVPKGDPAVYAYIKWATIVDRAVITQCVTAASLRLSPPGRGGRGGRGGGHGGREQKDNLMPVAGNSFKQIMAKRGHILWTIDQAENKTAGFSPAHGAMVVGLDVCHERKLKDAWPRTAETRSTVGFVASYDQKWTAFHSFVSFQEKGQEHVLAAEELMRKALEAYKGKNGSYPTQVIIIRDGVSESQLEAFVRREMQAYDRAFRSLGISPKVLSVVVQKRINLRLFAQCPKHTNRNAFCPFERCTGRDAYHSPLPGTVVDTQVCSKVVSDFYLVPSVAPPTASARPTRFVVLRDDFKLSSDELQNLMYRLCWAYYGWQGPIRVPQPCMLAHKCAYLFGRYVNGMPREEMSKFLYYL